jgi:arylsulfotransferase ASST
MNGTARRDPMTLRHYVAALLVALVALAASALACSGSTGSKDGGTDGQGRDATVEGAADAGPILIELSVTEAPSADASAPLVMVPPFSSSIHDYYVRCSSATNALTVSMEANPGSESLLEQPTTSQKRPKQTITPLTVKANQAVVAAATRGSVTVEYWVRCLPPDFPPIQMVSHLEAGTPTPGYYIVGNFDAVGATGGYAMVLNGNGVPVWYHLDPKGGVCDVDNIVDGGISYIPVAAGFEPLPFQLFELKPFQETNIAPNEGGPLDLHDLRALPDGGYVGITWPIETANLTGLSIGGLPDGGSVPGGPNSTIVGCDIVEFTSAGEVTWIWRGTAHLDPAKVSIEPQLKAPSYFPVDAGPVDGGSIVIPFHCNSVDVDPSNGNLVVSARQANSFWYVERSSGNILWKMGGTDASLDDSAYVPVPAPAFNGQHDVRLQPGWSTCAGGQISLYDDETYSGNPARALVYEVSLGGGSGCDGGIPDGSIPSATLKWQYAGNHFASASGSFRISSDGSRVIGWGLYPPPAVFTEVDEAGHVLLDFESPLTLGLPTPMGSYRAVKVPLTALSIDAMRASAGLTTP